MWFAARLLLSSDHQRMTRAVAWLPTQAARALDDLGEMFVHRMQHIHTTATSSLAASASASERGLTPATLGDGLHKPLESPRSQWPASPLPGT